MAIQNRRGPVNTKIRITKNSTIDGFGTGYGKGEYEVDRATALYFQTKGHAVILTPGVEGEGIVSEPTQKRNLGEQASDLDSRTGKGPNGQGTESEGTKSGGRAERGIPEGFPEAEKLKAAGFKTIDDLKVEGAHEKMAAITGIGPAALKKIGLALGE